MWNEEASKSENSDDFGIAKLVKDFNDGFQDKKIRPMNAEPIVIQQKTNYKA